jgi:homoserine O-acetyltransferase
MSSHDIGRDRGGLAAALSRVKARLVVAAVDSDRLYPLRLSEELIDARPDAGPLHLVKSPYGHDGFLIELDEVGQLIADALGSVRPVEIGAGGNESSGITQSDQDVAQNYEELA